MNKTESTKPSAESVKRLADDNTPDAGHPLLQRLVNSIEIVDGIACWDYFAMYEVRDALAQAEPAAAGEPTDEQIMEVAELWGLHHAPDTAKHYARAVLALAQPSPAAQQATNSEPLKCGHPQSLMLKSAETGEPLYCELCDALSRARDAEAMEAELRETVRNLTQALREDIEPQTFMGEPVRSYVAGRNGCAACKARLAEIIAGSTAREPVAWACTDYDGRVGVGITKEEAKQRAGELCTEFFPLYTATTAEPAAAGRELPPLPRPAVPNTRLPLAEAWANGSFSAEQMRTYALAALATPPAPAAQQAPSAVQLPEQWKNYVGCAQFAPTTGRVSIESSLILAVNAALIAQQAAPAAPEVRDGLAELANWLKEQAKQYEVAPWHKDAYVVAHVKQLREWIAALAPLAAPEQDER